MRSERRVMLGLAFLATSLFVVSGCSKPESGNGGGKTNGSAKQEAHDHPDEGPHHGALVEWGDEEFHVEFTVGHGKKEAVVYILDGTAKKAANVGADKIADVKLTITNVTPPVTIALKHDLQRSSDKGIALVGMHDALGKVMEFKGNVSGNVGGKSYSGDFEEHHDEDEHE